MSLERSESESSSSMASPNVEFADSDYQSRAKHQGRLGIPEIFAVHPEDNQAPWVCV